MTAVAPIDQSRRRQPRRGEGGRVPPQNLDAEQALLGAVLLRADILDEAADHVHPDHFARPAHAHIWEACLAVRARTEAVDPITVEAQLRRVGLADSIGDVNLTSLQAGAPSTSGWATYARIVTNCALRRRLIGIAGEIAEGAYDENDDLGQLLERSQSQLFALDDRRQRGGPVNIGANPDTYLAQLDARISIHAGGHRLTGITWGLDELDDITLGAQPGQLIIIGARPSMGKSSLVMGTAIAATAAGHVTLICSLEMALTELQDRYIATQSIIGLQHLRSGNITPGDRQVIEGWARHAETVPLVVDDEPGRTVAGIANAARRTKARHGRLDMLIVDYLQLVTSARDTDNRANDVAAITRGLKVLARQLEIPVVAASQLSRNLEQRADKRPMLSDLRESGGLEQDADIVIFIYRDHAYNTAANATDAELIVAKQRNGPTGIRHVHWDAATTRFLNRRQQYSPTPPDNEWDD